MIKWISAYVLWIVKLRIWLRLWKLRIFFFSDTPRYTFLGYGIPKRPLRKHSPIEAAIHEVRHEIQKRGIKLLTLKDIEGLTLSKKSINLIRRAASHKETEVDAEIVEQIGVILLREGKVEEFKNLMFHSVVPCL
jgi:hypothetical protein